MKHGKVKEERACGAKRSPGPQVGRAWKNDTGNTLQENSFIYLA